MRIEQLWHFTAENAKFFNINHVDKHKDHKALRTNRNVFLQQKAQSFYNRLCFDCAEKTQSSQSFANK
jgi:hypothetical protein